jgi:hypothetical protein
MRRPGLEPSTASKHRPRSIEALNSPFRRNASKRSIEPTCPHSANLSTIARSASPHLDAANHSCRRNANRLTPPSSSSRRREARHQAIDLPTKPESVLTISIDWPAEAHIEQFIPAVIEPACRAAVRTDPLSRLRRRRTVDPLHQASACAVKPELSPAGLGWFACGAFSLPAVLHRPGRGSRLGFGRAGLGVPQQSPHDNAKRRLSLQAEPRIVQRQVRPSERSEQPRNERSELPHIAQHRRNGEGANQQMARNAQRAKA